MSFELAISPLRGWRCAGTTLLITFFFAIVIAGCATRIPQEDLTSLNTTFVGIQKAGDLLYDETARVITSRTVSATPAGCGQDAAGIPKCFDPGIIGDAGVRSEDSSIAVRRLAVQLLSEYSLALVELNAGKTAEELSSTVNDIGGIAASIVSIAGVGQAGVLPAAFKGTVISSLAEFASSIERARSAETVRRSLIDERETVALMIDALIADTTQMYLIYYRDQQLQVVKGNTKLEDMRATTIAYNDALKAYVVLLRQAKSTHARLAQIASRTSTNPADLRAAVEEAGKIKIKGDAFWDAVRAIRKK